MRGIKRRKDVIRSESLQKMRCVATVEGEECAFVQSGYARGWNGIILACSGVEAA